MNKHINQMNIKYLYIIYCSFTDNTSFVE
jgi:hypothetical protein